MANKALITIPPQNTRLATQPNSGEIFGEIFATKNISFDQKGYIKLARRTNALVNNVTNFAGVTSISTLDGNTYYVVTSNNLFSIKLDGTAPTNLSTVSGGAYVGSLKFDGLTWYKQWYFSQDIDCGNYDPITGFNNAGMSLTTAKYHPLCVHEGLNQLAVGDGNTVKMYSRSSSTSHSLVVTITLPTNFEVRWIRYNNLNLYIGAKNTQGGEAVVYIADGTSTTANSQIVVKGSEWVFSGVIHKGVLHILTSSGQLMKYNGSGFDEVAHLPVFDTPYVWYDGNGFVNGKCESRGMFSDGELIYLNIDGYINVPGTIQLPNQPSGIWIYDENIGLYHRASPTADQAISYTSSSVDTTGNTITISGTYTAQTGTKVFLYQTNLTGLIAPAFYFLIRTSSSILQLSSTYNNAINGVAIPLVSGSSATVIIRDDCSFGESNQSAYQPGAIAKIDDLNSFITTYKEYFASYLLFGAGNIENYTNTLIYTLQSFCVGYNRGYIVSTKIMSSSIKDLWKKIYVKYGYLFEGNDKITAKYRIVDKEYYPTYISNGLTWIDSQDFYSTYNFSVFSIGDEVEFTSGRGAGCTAHITSIQAGSGVWIVGLAEAIPEVTAGDTTATCIVQNWTTLPALNENNGDFYNEYPLAKNSKWVQLKILLKGVSEPFLEEVQVINESYLASQ